MLEIATSTCASDAMTLNFFDEQLDQSETKARLVQKNFFGWANIVGSAAEKFGSGRIAYIDLFAGPGRYKNGAASTPLLVLEHALRSPRLAKMLVTYFNDADTNHSTTLTLTIRRRCNRKSTSLTALRS